MQFGTFQKLFPGLKYEAPYLTYWVAGMCVYILAAWLLEFIYLRNGGVRRLAERDDAPAAPRHALRGVSFTPARSASRAEG